MAKVYVGQAMYRVDDGYLQGVADAFEKFNDTGSVTKLFVEIGNMKYVKIGSITAVDFSV